MDEIEEKEKCVRESWYRLETLERTLKYKPLTSDQREAIEKEIQDLKVLLKSQEEMLKSLKTKRLRIMPLVIFSIMTCICILGLYKVYSMWIGDLDM